MSMDKEKILAAARNDKRRGQEYENKESIRGSLLGELITLIIGVGLFLLEYYVKNSINFGLIAVVFTASGVDALYEGIRLKKHHLTMIGSLMSLGAVVAILFFLRQVVLA